MFPCLIVEGDISTRPEDKIVLRSRTVILNCSTDLQEPMNWQHTPVGSSETIQFYYLEEMAQLNDSDYQFYSSTVRVDTFISGHYNLVIESADSRHAGQYDCLDKDGMNKIMASADLNVIGEGH